MESQIKSLWMLSWALLISVIVDFLPDVPSTITSLATGVLSIIALVKLSRRNEYLRKAKTYTIAMFLVLVGMMLSVFIFPNVLGLLMMIAIGGRGVILVLSFMGFYNQLNGLGDMAEEAGDAAHACRLRRLIAIFFIVGVAVATMEGINPALKGVALIAKVAVTAYQIYLYYQSIRIERRYERQIIEHETL